jgi:hypothetical protein
MRLVTLFCRAFLSRADREVPGFGTRLDRAESADIAWQLLREADAWQFHGRRIGREQLGLLAFSARLTKKATVASMTLASVRSSTPTRAALLLIKESRARCPACRA